MDYAKVAKLHSTKTGFFVFGIVELSIAYGFASLSIDRGNLWWYLLTVTFLIGGLKNFIKLIKDFIHGNKTAKT